MKRKPRNIAIFGCGPAALTAAAACVRAGFGVEFFSQRKQPSYLYGCQYLRQPIRGYESVANGRLDVQLTGTPEEYRDKVYGPGNVLKVAPEDVAVPHDAWDLRETYAQMWGDIIEYAKAPFHEVDISARGMARSMAIFNQGFDLTISTVPAPLLCRERDRHFFGRHVVWESNNK